jgi:hypothetical protein
MPGEKAVDRIYRINRIREEASSSLVSSPFLHLDNPVNPVYFFSVTIAVLSGFLIYSPPSAGEPFG